MLIDQTKRHASPHLPQLKSKCQWVFVAFEVKLMDEHHQTLFESPLSVKWQVMAERVWVMAAPNSLICSSFSYSMCYSFPFAMCQHLWYCYKFPLSAPPLSEKIVGNRGQRLSLAWREVIFVRFQYHNLAYWWSVPFSQEISLFSISEKLSLSNNHFTMY